MRKIFAFLCLISALSLPLALSSCTRDTSGSVYELTSQAWMKELDGGAVVSLEFANGAAELTVISGDAEIHISGGYAADNSSFVIFDDGLYRNYLFDYEVKGEKLELSYDGNTLTLEKE